MKKLKTVLSVLLAICMIISVIPVASLGAENEIVLYQLPNGGYLGLNKNTGVLEKAVAISSDVAVPSEIEGITVVGIGEGAFKGTAELTRVTIPPTVTFIEMSAFEDCPKLTSVTLPDSLEVIGEKAFAHCTELQNMAIPASVKTISDGMFEGCTRLTNIAIYEGTEVIGSSAFRGCESLKKIEIPYGVTTIGASAFEGCSLLDTIVLLDDLTSIGEYAFKDCVKLENLILPASITRINNYTFKGCTALKSLTVPESVTSIAPEAFADTPDFTMYVVAGSYAQVYASANSMKMELGVGPNGPTEEEEDPPIEIPYTDIENHWGKAYIIWAYENEIFTGVTETLFKPEAQMNRAMFATAMYRVEDEPPIGENPFTDVKAGEWFEKPVAWGYTTGIIQGVSETKFAPGRNITREQIATLLYRYAVEFKGQEAGTLSTLENYTDAGKISPYALEAMQWAVGNGIITGKTTEMLDPLGEAKRVEVAAMIMRCVDPDAVPPEPKPEPEPEPEEDEGGDITENDSDTDLVTEE